ncbi:MAG: hypothetical protein JO356_13805 [Acidobacteria bacterium]|nr:hypothetical protein [Acidobacteriota bacterium]
MRAFCPECGQAVEQFESEERARDLQAAVLGALAYLTFLPALLFLIIPPLRRHSFVRFHSWQSIFFAVLSLLLIVVVRLLFALLSLLPGIGFLLAWLCVGVVSIAVVIVWLVLVLKAALGRVYQLPWIGAQAARLAG